MATALHKFGLTAHLTVSVVWIGAVVATWPSASAP